MFSLHVRPATLLIAVKMLREVSVATQKSLRPALLKSNGLYLSLPLSDFWSVSVPKVNSVFCILPGAVPVLHKAVHGLSVGD